MDKEYVVVSAMRSGEYQTQYGKMVKYLTMFEGEQEGCEWSMKPESPVPQPGDKVFGHIENGQYGKKFKKVSQGGGGGGGFRGESPEKQANISRQNALTNAVSYCIAKANMMTKEKAVAYLTGKQIVEVAKYFTDFTSGKLNFDGVASEQPASAPAQTPVAPTQTTIAPDTADGDPGYDPSEYEGI